MSPLDACMILGLQPGRTYSATQLKEAAAQEEARARAIFRFPAGDLARQEEARKKLLLVQKAAGVLMAEITGGKLCVQPRPTAPAAPVRPASGTPAARAGGQSPVAPAPPAPVSTAATVSPASAWTMLKRALRAFWDLVVVVWWLLTCPVRCLVERKLVRSALSLTLVALLVWLSWTLLTGGVPSLTAQVRAASDSVNTWIGRLIR